MKRYTAALVLLAALLGSAAAWDTRPTPVTPDGKTLQLPLPASEHMQNVGGSDGAGLCVYTSVVLSAKWHNIPDAIGLRKFAEGRPGGSWPEKLAKDIKLYSDRQGVVLPAYIQHTGGDDAFLDLCIKTRRYPGITYAGQDDFYSGTIAHMVNLTHLDDKYGTIQDNNRAGKWTTDTRRKVLNRWKGLDDSGRPLRIGGQAVGGGWAFVWLAPPAPPLKIAPDVEFGSPTAKGTWERVVLHDSYKLQDNPFTPDADVIVWVYRVDGVILGGFHNRRFYELFTERFTGDVIGLGDERVPPLGVTAPDDPTDPWNHGIDTGKLTVTPRYFYNEVEVSQAKAYALLTDDGGLVDDSDKYHLSIVGGDKKSVLALFASGGKLEKYARRLHVQVYRTDAWPVKAGLKDVVTLQEPAARGGKVVGTATAGDPESLSRVLGDVFDVPVKPKPEPVVPPEPKPTPAPTPDPVVPPAPDDKTDKCILCGLLAALIWFLTRGKK